VIEQIWTIVGLANTEQKAFLVGLHKSEAKARDAKIASRTEMLDDVENGTSDLKMVDTSNQDEVNKYKICVEEVVTDGHGKGNLIYVCDGEMNKDHLLKGNETTGFLTAQTRNNMIVNGSGGRLTFADLEITSTHYFDDVDSNTNASATSTLKSDDVNSKLDGDNSNTCIKVHVTYVAVAKNSFHGLKLEKMGIEVNKKSSEVWESRHQCVNQGKFGPSAPGIRGIGVVEIVNSQQLLRDGRIKFNSSVRQVKLRLQAGTLQKEWCIEASSKISNQMKQRTLVQKKRRADRML
jgi:hypothetical protein